MQLLEQTLTFFFDHKEVLTTLLVSLIAILKLTSWGRSQSAALDAVIGIIERVGDKKVKTDIAAQERQLKTGARDALHYAVSKADPKKKTIGVATRVAQKVLRGVLPPKM